MSHLFSYLRLQRRRIGVSGICVSSVRWIVAGSLLFLFVPAILGAELVRIWGIDLLEQRLRLEKRKNSLRGTWWELFIPWQEVKSYLAQEFKTIMNRFTATARNPKVRPLLINSSSFVKRPSNQAEDNFHPFSDWIEAARMNMNILKAVSVVSVLM